MGSGISRVKTGSYEGTGAAQDITGDKVGFQPKRVSIYRIDTAQDLAEWVEGMPDDSFLKTAGGTGVRSLVTTQGVTPAVDGFSLGTNASVNNSGDTYIYVAEE